MRGDKDMRKVALQVSIALAAGMFSIVPVAYGAPVGGNPVVGGATISYSDVENVPGAKDTNISSTTQNNVIDWHDFSVDKDEAVIFDGGDKTRNYMNVVTGANTSEINGVIKGGNEVYIVNPNGVIFGEKASVDVGSLYASTRYVKDSVKEAIDPAGTTMASVIEGSASPGMGTDIVNMGAINATKVVMEGQNVRFVHDVTKVNAVDNSKMGVTATTVVLNADTTDEGYIHVGYNSDSAPAYTGNTTVENFKLLGSDWSDIQEAIAADTSGNYMLSGNVNAGGANTAMASTFSGKFDGNNHVISNIQGAPALFSTTNGADIYNVGVVESTFSSSSHTGAIVSDANAKDDKNTVLKNVYNTSTVNGRRDSGGLVGYGKGVTIIQSYNTGTVSSNYNNGSAFIGYIDSGTNEITDSYSTGNVRYGLCGGTASGTTLTINRAYSRGDSVLGNSRGSLYAYNVLIDKIDNLGESTGTYYIYPANYRSSHLTTTGVDTKVIATYTGTNGDTDIKWGAANISNVGGVVVDKDTAVVTRPVWRIYEGQTMPLLTSQFKGIKNTVYNFGYFKSGAEEEDTTVVKYNDGYNNAKDLPAYTYGEELDGLVYNGEYLKMLGSDGKAATDSSAAFIKSEGKSVIDTSLVTYDTSGQKNATFTKTDQSSGTQNKWAMLYSSQKGYDLYGNNIEIAPRKVAAQTSDIGSVMIVKEYDGNSKASSSDIDNFFSGDTATVSGILPEDAEAGTKVNFGGTATFKKNGANAHKVGVYTYTPKGENETPYTDEEWATMSYVDIQGTLSLTDDTNNYILPDTSFTGKGQGVITQKTLTISLNHNDYSRVYNNHAIAKGAVDGKVKVDGVEQDNSAVSASDFTLTVNDENFTAGELGGTFKFTDDNGDTVNESVQVAFDPAAYYVESDKTTTAYAKDDDGNPILKNGDTIERADVGDYENRVRFGGLKLSGDTVGNYKLVDSQGTVLYSANDAITVTKNLQNEYVITTTPAVTTGGSLYASGTVTQRPITSTGFSWKDNTDDVTRPYNGKWEYEEPKGSTVSNAEAATPDSGMLEGDSLTFTVQSAKFVNSEEGSLVNNVRTATPTKNVADAKGVLYTVQITGAAARNYTLDGADINTNGTNTVIGPGHITPRTINLIVNSAVKAEKDYDGTAESDSYTLTDSILSAGTGVLKYQSDDTANHFLGDIDPNANVTVTGTYQPMPAAENTPAVEAKDVYYNEATDTVLDKNIVYDAKVMEGSEPSKNYKFAIINNGNTVVTPLNADYTEASFAGTDALGVINQREIDEVVFSNTMNKTFDDDYEVKNIVNNGEGILFKTNDRITVTDLKTNGESALAITGDSIDDVLNTTNGQITEGSTGDNALIVGSYGEKTNNVWAPNKHAGDKVIRYTMRDAIWKTNNYKVTANAVIEGTGRIDTLPIDAVDIKIERNSTPISKIYNGDANVSTTADAVGNIDRDAKDYLNRVYVSKGGKTLNLDVSVDGATFETRHHKNESGSTDLRVTYTLGFANSTDYSIEGLNNNQLRRSVDADGNNITGSITPRPIRVTTDDIVNNDVEAGGVVKTYDALDTVNGSGEALVANINDQILSIDTNVTNATTGNYNNKNVNTNDTANLDNDGLKPVTYNLALANNDTYGDYKFVDGNGTEIATLAGRGTINKLDIRPITTEAYPVKTYDGDDTAENKLTTENTHFGLESDWDTNKEIVVTRDQIDLSKISGKYQITGTEENAADVNRSDPAQKKNVLYSGVLAALGENAGNYIVEDTFTGTGRIKPGSIDHTSFIFNLLDNITQTYSGSADVGEYGMDADTKKAFQRSWVNTLTSGIDTDGDRKIDISLGDKAYDYLIEKAAFTSADAGTGNKHVDYKIHVDVNSINNYDYDEQDPITKDNIHLTDSIDTGTIKQRNITAYVTHDQLSKYYDKTEAIYNNDNPAYSGAAGGNVLTGAEAVTFKTYVADGTTTQTGLLPNYGANESFGEYDGAGVGTNNKIINYTAKVSDAYSNNYTFTLLDAENGNEVTALSTTKNTINPFGVVLTAGETTKVYDGLKDVTAEKAAAALQLGANYDNLALTNVNENTGKYDNPNRQGGAVHVVTYTGFELENPNYYLAKADGTPINTNDDGKNVITGDGYIDRYTLTAIPNFTVHDVTKEYDGDDLVKYNRSLDKDLIKQNFVTPENIPSSLAYELNSATYTDSNRGEGKHADFVIEISGDNYDFSYLIDNHLVESGTDSIVKTYSTDSAVITPRKVYVALKNNTEISKVYDGGLDLEDADMALIRTADQEIYIPGADDILAADKANVHIDWSGIQAAYTEKDAGNDIPVKYTISLTNNAAGNYELYKASDGTAITDANKLTGSGAITKAVLNLSPEAINRSYAKGNSNITLDAGKLRLQGVNGETATFSAAALAKITGQYGKGGSEAAFEADENVSWDGNTVIHKDVYYTGLSDALAVMNGDNNTNSITKNYTIDDTAFFAADEAKGKIEPITITQPAVENWKPVIREYNADTDLNEVYDYTGNVKGNQLGINDILNLTVDDIEGNPLNIEYTATGKYDNKNAGNDHVLEYHINTVTKKVKDGTGYANYVLDTSVLDHLVNQDLDSRAEQVYSVITPRQLNADVVKQYGNRKIYNGNENADTSNFVLDEADQAILTKDGILDKVVKTAKYNNKNASVDPDAEDTNTKTITYTLALNDNSGNYEIATPEASALGDIERRKVSVVGQSLTGIDKPYDGDTSLPGTFVNSAHFNLAATDANTGIIDGETDIQLDVDAIKGAYENKHAGSGKTINFREFKLKDTAPNSGGSADNYYMTTDLLTGTGTIYQKALNVGINAAPIKGYDATTAVSDNYATVDNLDYLSGVLGQDEVNLQLVSAEYGTADAGTGKKYDYKLTIANPDYKLAYGDGFVSESVSDDGQSAVFTAYDGIINKRKVYVSLADTPKITKTYDGDTGVEQDVTDKIIVRDGDLLTSLDGTELDRSVSAINARYDNKDAGTGKTVTYDVNLAGSAAKNYEIHRLSNINTAADTIYSTLEGKGDIEKAVLTLDPAAISKTYNGTAKIGDGIAAGDEALTADKLVLRGVNNESFTFTDAALAKVSGQYGFGNGDANVSWNGEEVAHKDVMYTGLSDALAIMNSSDSTNEISKNYTIDNTAYFTAAQGKGKIKPITITQAVTEKWKPVIREYNADTDLDEVYDYSGKVKGNQLGINDILNLTVNDIEGNPLNVDYTASGAYDNKNVGNSHVLEYHINSVNKKVKDGLGYANYVLDTSVLDHLVNQDLDSRAEQVYSVITPRQLNADVVKQYGNRKIYNGDKNADPSNFVLDEADQAILTKDGILDKLTITAEYNNKHASADPDEITNNKDITYHMSLDDNSGNYEIATPTGKAWGDIERRKVYVKTVNVEGIEKEYDTTTDLPDWYSNDGRFELVAADTNTGIINGEEDIQLNSDKIKGSYVDSHVHYNDDGSHAPQDIEFKDFALKDSNISGGGYLGDYYMVTTSLSGSGTIYPKTLTVGIKEAPTKEYDTYKAISTDYATKNNLDYLSGVLGTDEVNLQITSADYVDANADTNKKYSYGISIDNTDYRLDQGNGVSAIDVSNDGQSAVLTAYDGIINKRKVYVSLADSPKITKTYDGDIGVEQDVTDMIIVRAGDLLNDGTKLNRNVSAINARYDNKDAGIGKTVTYDVNLTGSAARNYEIHRLANINTADDTIYSTLEGKGDIEKAILTLDPASISKTYNGTAVIGDGVAAGDEALTADKLVLRGVNNESFTFTDAALAKVSGQYGFGAGDANVSWNGEEVAHKDVMYTGLMDALAVMNGSDSTNAISKNYTIGDTAYFTAAQGKGKIKPITITQAVTEKWKPVIREYNADTDLTAVYDYSTGEQGAQLGIKDILQLTVTDGDGNPLTIDYEAVGNYDNKNVGGSHVLNYHIDSVNKKVKDGSGYANYVLDTSVLDSLDNADLDSASEQVYSVITKRQLNAAVKDSKGNRKIYDGTRDADAGNFVLDAADKEVLAKDSLLNDVVIAAYYDDPNVNVAPGETANGKEITYTLKLDGDNSNYEIVTPTASALGDIEQRKLVVVPVDVDGIDRTYDGTRNLPDGYTNDGRFAFAATDDKARTGVVNGEEDDIQLNTAAIKGLYADGHVHRNADGTLAAQNIDFSDFTLQDNAAGKNYYIATDHITGSGTISPATLTVKAQKAPEKEYDRSTDLPAGYLTAENIQLTGLFGDDDAKLQIVSGSYADAAAGQDKKYSYDIVIDNGDYELSQADITAADNGQKGTVTAYDGIITPRQLNASVKNITGQRKIYDGTSSADIANFVLDADDQAILAGDNLLGNIVITADYADKHASAAPDEIKNSKEITYTLSLTGNNGNYEIATPTGTAWGDIEQRRVDVEAVDVDGINKTYDTTTAMSDGYSGSGRFALAAAAGETGIVAGDEDIVLDTQAVEGAYKSAHVQRNADGTPAAQKIMFRNFTLQDTNAANDNRVNDYYVATDSLVGSGTITPAALTVDIVDAPVKTYDGETALSSTYAANSNLKLNGVLNGDSANVLIQSADYSDANAGTNKKYTYDIALDNDDYELVQGQDKPVIETSSNGQSGSITAYDGTITPRVLNVSSIADMTKEYDGTTDGAENAVANISLNNYIAKDKDNLGLTVTATYDNANAGISEDSDELVNHKVTYTLSLSNKNYQLEEAVVTGEGTIFRKGLNIVATPVAVNMSEAMPEFSGTVEGLVSTDSNLASYFSFAPYETTTTNVPGSYEVYGWYSSRTSGNLGLNYTFAQDAGNDTAFTVNYINTNISNPDTKITPNSDIYQQISKDMNSGFGDNGAAAIEYRDKNGNVVGRENIDSGDIHGRDNFVGSDAELTNQDTELAKIGIVGGDIVNIEGADAASTADIEVSNDGMVINLEVISLQEEEHEDKAANKDKEGEIDIENSDEGDEIELKVEDEGVNVA